MTQRRHPPATVPPDHPAAKLPRRRLAVLRPGMVVEGVITRMVRGGALVDIQLESGEPAFIPLTEIPAKAMPKVRQLLEQGKMQSVRIVQLDRASGTATASLQGLLKGVEGQATEATGDSRNGRQQSAPAPEPPPARPPAPPKMTASERARKQQEAIFRRLRGEET
ncbi:MAG: S1 RNA-binding domain-containing protein [Chloroflexota bacterium]